MTPPSPDEALRRLLDEGRARAATTDPQHAALWQALSDATEGGKRFRPALVTAAHDALGGTADAAAAEVGAAVELLHTAFLVHDDVIDDDMVRRGRPNVSGTFESTALMSGVRADEARAFGHAAGILAGDLALAAAVRAVAMCGASAAVVHRLLDLFDTALHITAAGELADVRLSLAAAGSSVRASLAMEAQKTSAYSFVLPLQAGAVLAGADEATVRRLGEAGALLGVGFQLLDDLLGVFGDPDRTGKSATSDLRARKQTPLLAHAQTTPQWDEIRSYVGRDLTDVELEEVRRLLMTSGSRQFVEELATAHIEQARSMLHELGLPTDLLKVVAPPDAIAAQGKEVAA